MKALLSFLFRWRPTGQTSVAFGTGIIAVALSAAMIPLDRWPLAVILVRDIGQMLLVGFLFPLIHIRRSDADFASFGLTMRRWYLFLPINIGLAALLYLKLMSSSPPPPGFQLDALALWNAGYVMVALSFELLFFYAFLRTLFERAFGPVVAVVLAALFYSLHHVGFQPEFAKLFLVGLLYATVFRLGNSALLIYPFFLAVGGIHDVLFKSQVVATVQYPAPRTLVLSALMLAAVVWAWRSKHAARVPR
jgi:membrane protease YdiL (CAAX protease family)